MTKMCDMKCFRCKRKDCENDMPPTKPEIAIIEADNRYVLWSRLTDAEKEKRRKWRAYSKDFYYKKKARAAHG